MQTLNDNGRIPRLFILITCLIIPIISIATLVNNTAAAQTELLSHDAQQTKNETTETIADNEAPQNAVSATLSHTTFLPLISNPFILTINNSGEGNFQASWGNIGAGSTYTLVEDTEPMLTDPHYFPQTSDLTTPVSGRVAGTYYYRVQGKRADGKVLWSNVETAVVTRLMIDDFEDGADPNKIGGAIEWHGDCKLPSPGGYDFNNPYTGNYGYRLTYGGITSNCWAAWQTGLGTQDFSGFSNVVFAIKGARGNEIPNIYLRNNENKSGHVDIETYITVTDDWQEVKIPLSDFAYADGADLTSLAWFQIVFEWDNMSGTIYIDDIHFE